MNTNEKKEVITDVIPDKQNIRRMVDTAWQIVATALFAQTKHDNPTRAKAKTFILNFIIRSDNAYKNYAEFCQRIIMVRHYMSLHTGFQIRFGIVNWLNPDIERGFAGTARWFDRLMYSRKQNPIHQLELKAFPEAMLELAEEATPEIFNYWNDWLLERNATEIQQMLMLVGPVVTNEAAWARLAIGIE